MKNKFFQLIPAGFLWLILATATGFAQTGQKPAVLTPPAAWPVPGPIDPRTGLPVAASSAPGPIDPQTGLPVNIDQWISPDWTDPDMTLTNIGFDGLPASAVGGTLRELFHDKFDILISKGWTAASGENIDPANWLINLHLKNVTASEIFRAMNLLAENDNTPFHWKLFMNGQRPTVFLQVIPQLMPPGSHPAGTPTPVGPKQVMVYYVGDLIGDGGMTLKDISDTLTDVNNKTYGGDIYIAFHEETQLVIVKGTGEQLSLVHNTLDALKQKMQYNLRQKTDPATGLPAGGGSGGGLK